MTLTIKKNSKKKDNDKSKNILTIATLNVKPTYKQEAIFDLIRIIEKD